MVTLGSESAKHCLIVLLQVGVTMAQTVTDPLLLESCVRDELNVTAPRQSQQLLQCSFNLVNVHVCQIYDNHGNSRVVVTHFAVNRDY